MIKKKVSWHSAVTILVVTLVPIDWADIIASRFLNLYILPMHLFNDASMDTKLGIIISDVVMMPPLGVVTCYYYAKYKKWWIPFLTVVTMVLMEGVMVHLHYMEYINFDPIYTACFYVISLLLYVNYADRLINYNPPISYAYVLFFATYIIMGIFFTIFGGSVLELFMWRPGIFSDHVADCWFVEIPILIIFGFIASLTVPKLKNKLYRALIFLSFSILGITFSMYMLSKGMLIYNKWNTALMILRYVVPSTMLIFYDRWESSFIESKIDETYKSMNLTTNSVIPEMLMKQRKRR
jgi:hypothetical protein